MQTTIYDKNCAALVAKYGDMLPMQPPKPEDIQARIKVVNGELGFPNVAFVSDNELHRLYEEPNPYKEIQALVEKELNDPDVTHIVTMGMGLGYLLAELIRCKEDKAKVFVLEPDMNILYECLRFVDLSAMIQNEKVDFIFENDGALAGETMGGRIQLTDASFKGWRFVSVFNSFRIYGEFTKSFIRVFGSKMNGQKLNLNTIQVHGHTFIQNNLTNLSLLNGNSYLSSYKDFFKAKSCVIISAGPSLNKQLEKLKEIQNDIVLFAAGQTIRTLHAAGINPHFVVGVDPQPELAAFFESDKYKNEVLISNTVCNSSTIQKFRGHIIFTNYTPEIDERMAPIVGLMGSVNNGGSIANFTYSVAKYMGFQNIAFVGQDLAYTNGVSHANGYLGLEKKTETEMQADKAFRKVPGYHGGVVFTNSQMDMYRDWFETHFKADKEIRAFNCTEGGAWIEGSTHIPLIEFLSAHLCKNSTIEIPQFPQKINLKKLQTYLQNDLEYIKNARDLASTGIRVCNQTIQHPNKSEVLVKAKSCIVKTRKFLVGLNSKTYNPYLTVLWSHSLHEIAKVDTPENATPPEVVKPFIPFFSNLKNACQQTEMMLVETLQLIKKNGDPQVAIPNRLEPII